MKNKTTFLIIVWAFLFVGQICLADVTMPAIFADNMVLQQKTEVAVWGWAKPGEKVKVKGSWKWLWPKSVCADKDGKWSIKIKTPNAGGPFELKIKGNNTISFTNVMTGEVWLCSGQSNMQMTMQGWDKQPIEGGEEEIKNADYPMIRLFTVQRTAATKPADDCEKVLKWAECTPDTAKSFSAIGYFFGKELYKELNVPIGLIHSSWGGTPAESWTRREILANDNELKIITERSDKVLAKWRADVTKAKVNGTPEPKRPLPTQHSPSYLYNGMINPIIPYGIKGAIWYQGESNAGRAYQYRRLFPVMIKNWRDDWGIGNFPFHFVQLASYLKHQPGIPLEVKKGEPVDDAWAELREAQLMTLQSVPNTGMAVAIDIGQANNIHPAKKKEVGQRLALWALANDYGKDILNSGPIYKSMNIEGSKIRLNFDYAKCGLKSKGGELEGFAIAGPDRKFVWANAEIDSDTVIVYSKDIPNPVAVRYAWTIFPFCNLYNKADLPASPFRTDDWPPITINNK